MIAIMTLEVIEIVQEYGNGKSLTARLMKGRELRIENVMPRKTIACKIDIVALKDESKRKIILGWKWLVAGIVAVLVSVSIPQVFSNIFTELLFTFPVYLSGILLGAVCFYLAWKGTTVKQVFYTRNADVPVVEFFVNRPTKKEFAAFIHKLEEYIMDVQHKLDLSMKNQLAGEMKMLRRLAGEGVLSSSDYNKAKAVLFSKH